MCARNQEIILWSSASTLQLFNYFLGGESPNHPFRWSNTSIFNLRFRCHLSAISWPPFRWSITSILRTMLQMHLSAPNISLCFRCNLSASSIKHFFGEDPQIPSQVINCFRSKVLCSDAIPNYTSDVQFSWASDQFFLQLCFKCNLSAQYSKFSWRNPISHYSAIGSKDECIADF